MWRAVGAAREPDLARLLDLAESILTARSVSDEARIASRKVFKALNRRTGVSGISPPQCLPVCDQLFVVCAAMATEAPPLPEFADALRVLENRLTWKAAAQPSGEGFAIATLIGNGGIEHREDIAAGFLLLAPGAVTSVDENVPEEVHIAMTAGEWKTASKQWAECRPGSILHHALGIPSAVRAGREPLLTLWLSPIE